jgi:hypothetical protein
MDHAQGSYGFPITPEDLGNAGNQVKLPIEDRIRIRAYERYQQRGYLNGFDLEDWLTAEREIMEDESQG